jgi:hypothetical protein
MNICFRILAGFVVASALAGCASTGNYHTSGASNWYAKQCGYQIDQLGLCPYNRF